MSDIPNPFCVSKVAERHWHIVSELISGQNEESEKSTEPPRVLRGVTYDDCQRDNHCEGGRRCMYNEKDKRFQCNGKSNCSCQPEELELCTSAVQCETREVCAKDKTVKDAKGFCSSAVKVGSNPNLEVITTGGKRPDSSPASGLTGFPCAGDSGCKGGRKCRARSNNGEISACSSPKGCMCFPNKPGTCEKTIECADVGEVCVHDQVAKSANGPSKICISADVEASTSNFVEVSKKPDDQKPQHPEEGEEGLALKGVTFDPCHDTDKCENTRTCISGATLKECKEQDDCFCKPPKRLACSSRQDCELREVCAKGPKEDGYYCLSKIAAGRDPKIEEIKTGPPRQEKSKSAGLTLFPCKININCKGDRKCVDFNSDKSGLVTCEVGASCFCAVVNKKPLLCSRHNACEQGEICATVVKVKGGPSFLPENTCIAADVVAGEPYLESFDDPHKLDKEDEDDDSPTLKGVTFDPCKKSSECEESRTCVTLASGQPCNGQFCSCRPEKLKACTLTRECDSRESCVILHEQTKPICASSIFAKTDVRHKAVPNDKPHEKVNDAQGKTLYPCTSDSGCVGERICQMPGVDRKRVSCPSGRSCLCLPQKSPDACKAHGQCEKGEVCSKVRFNSDLFGLPDHACLSADVEAANPFIVGIEVPENGPDVTTGGVTLDVCHLSKDCAGKRTCVAAVLNSVPCNGAKGCICYPDKLRDCSSHTQCEPREVCAKGILGTGNSKQHCASAVHVGFHKGITAITVGPPKSQNGKSLGLTGWPCVQNTAVCKDGRECVDSEPKSGKQTACGASSQKCYCFATKFDPACTKDSDCITDGEVCAEAGGGKPSFFPSRLCVSEDVEAGTEFLVGVSAAKVSTTLTVSPSPSFPSSVSPSTSPIPSVSPSAAASVSPSVSPSVSVSPTISTTPAVTPSPGSGSRNAVCVDAAALAGMKRDKLVFAEHRLAEVLCDGNGSCATAGHMVVFEGRTMMMRTYCAAMGCTKRKILVNSPKYQLQLRVPSKTEGLFYTAFAARYATRMEEVALKTAVHAGL